MAGFAPPGLFARKFAKALGLKEAEEAFAGALLQDMAVPLLAKELPLEYAALLTAREGGKRRLSELEMERFGWTHAIAAADMARNWNLPREFADLVERHAMLDQNRARKGAAAAAGSRDSISAIAGELRPGLDRSGPV